MVSSLPPRCRQDLNARSQSTEQGRGCGTSLLRPTSSLWLPSGRVPCVSLSLCLCLSDPPPPSRDVRQPGGEAHVTRNPCLWPVARGGGGAEATRRRGRGPGSRCPTKPSAAAALGTPGCSPRGPGWGTHVYSPPPDTLGLEHGCREAGVGAVPGRSVGVTGAQQQVPSTGCICLGKAWLPGRRGPRRGNRNPRGVGGPLVWDGAVLFPEPCLPPRPCPPSTPAQGPSSRGS